MKQSQLATKTLREAPSDEQSVNAILLTRAGFIDKLGAGIYSFLPLGLRVLRKIENIVREEMIKAGGQEILMPVLHPKENWQKTGRWDSFDVLFKSKGIDEKDYALGATHEEIVSPLAKKIILSYKDLPLYLFQIQTKFRNELRAKSGILRTREFSMKDLYSFHANEADLNDYYEKMTTAYFNVFTRCGLRDYTHLTAASGGSFAKYSHEFQTISEAGEDKIHICQNCDLAINEEIKAETPACPDCGGTDFKTATAIEVGNIFKLGTKYSRPFELKYRDEKGAEQDVIMGCYGIGPSRLMGAVVEIFHDEKGIVWPEEVAPFKYHLLVLDGENKTKRQAQALGAKPRTESRSDSGAREAADEIYSDLQKAGIEVLYDDRDLSAGAKFAEADLIGLPYRLVISEKTLAQKSVELKKRNEEKTELIKINKIVSRLKT